MKKFIAILAFFIFTLNLASAQVGGTITKSLPTQETKNEVSNKKYFDVNDFLKNEGATCQVATDGCNTIQVFNGALGASTMMYCEDVYGEKGQKQYSCLKYSGELSKNDQEKYDSLVKKADLKYLKDLSTVISKFKVSVEKLSQSQKRDKINEITDKINTILDEKIYNKYPQDKALPKKLNDLYIKLELIKLELEKIY